MRHETFFAPYYRKDALRPPPRGGMKFGKTLAMGFFLFCVVLAVMIGLSHFAEWVRLEYFNSR